MMKRRQLLGIALAAILTLGNGTSMILATPNTENDDFADSGFTEITPKPLSEDQMKKMVFTEGPCIKYQVWNFEEGASLKKGEVTVLTEENTDCYSLTVRKHSSWSYGLVVDVKPPLEDKSITYYGQTGQNVDGNNVGSSSLNFDFDYVYDTDTEQSSWKLRDVVTYAGGEPIKWTENHILTLFTGPKNVKLDSLKLSLKSETDSSHSYTPTFTNLDAEVEFYSFTAIPDEGLPAPRQLGAKIPLTILTEYLEKQTGHKVTITQRKGFGEEVSTEAAGVACVINETTLYGLFSPESEGGYALRNTDFYGNHTDLIDIYFSEESSVNPGPDRPSRPSTPSKPSKPTEPTGDSTPTISYRLYNPNTGEHFYTTNKAEHDMLKSVGWNSESGTWELPTKSNYPIYRLYNPNSGDHHYTLSEGEKNALIGYGWKDEGIGMYSADDDGEVIYRLYNPNAKVGQHHYTNSKAEKDMLVKAGWKDEGTGWYGLK